MEVALPHRAAQARRTGGPATPPITTTLPLRNNINFERREDCQRVSAHIGKKPCLTMALHRRQSQPYGAHFREHPMRCDGTPFITNRGSRDICCDFSGTGQSHTPIDNSIKEPDMRTRSPTMLKACPAPNSIIILADAAICGNIWDQHVCNLASTQCPLLTAPGTPLAHRLLALPLNNIGPETHK